MNWIKKYNSHSGLRSYKNRGVAAMIKGCKSTWEERINIILFCLSQNRDYYKAVEKHQVSYQQVYQWVKKYILETIFLNFRKEVAKICPPVNRLVDILAGLRYSRRNIQYNVLYWIQEKRRIQKYVFF